MTFTATQAEDWRTYNHDHQRSSVTSDTITLPLKQVWNYKSPAPPVPAWADPARWDAWRAIKELPNLRNFDPVFYTTSSEENLYWGSSSDFGVHCFDVKTGREKWSFFTEGPVRTPPEIYKDKIYFGSDDGFVYCISSDKGELIWKYSPMPDEKKIATDGKFISRYPSRTGVIVKNGIAYCTFSLFLWNPSWLCALNADIGKVNEKGMYIKKYSRKSFQGAMLLNSDKLVVLAGRAPADIFNATTGQAIASLKESGGVECTWTTDNYLISRSGNQRKARYALNIFPLSGNTSAPLSNSIQILSDKGVTYILKNREITAVRVKDFASTFFKAFIIQQKIKNKKFKGDKSRLKKELALLDKLLKTTLWSTKVPMGFYMVKSANYISLGCENRVVILGSEDGKIVQTLKVSGNAYGLSIANNRLFVSTDAGSIYCFINKFSRK